jgi:tellurite methyltransferase
MPASSDKSLSSKKISLQDKWNQRYSNSDSAGQVCRVLNDNAHLLPASGRSLDLACGLGGNALYLAEQGLDSHAWDISTTALDTLSGFALHRGLQVCTEQRDIETSPPAAANFNVIVVSQFLFRPLFPALVEALKTGGLLFYQTFNQQKLSASGPSNPEYLLSKGELLQQLSLLELLFYREDGDTGKLDKGLRNCSYFVGKKLAQ